MNHQLKAALASKCARAVAVTAATLGPVAAIAAPPDFSSITGAVDWSSVITGVVTVLAAGAAVIVAFIGGRFLIKAIRGA